MPGTDRELRGLRSRSEFLKAARGQRTGRPGFSLQVAAVADDRPGIGYTVTKKTGNAPQRNRIKRRLRAAVRACGPAFQSQHDYVLVGRPEALAAPFSTLVADLRSSIAKIHANQATSPGTRR